MVVAHSGAGLLLPAVADRLEAVHLVWLAAAVPDFDGGSSFLAQIERAGPELAHEEWRRFGRESTEDPAAVYAESAPARPDRPSTYVLPRQDRTLRPEWMGTAARERLGVEPIEIDGGRFPHVSRSDLLADVLEHCRG